jgi:hypothetical protein
VKLTKDRLLKINARLVLALAEIIREWETSRDVRDAVERGKIVLDDAMASAVEAS